MRSLIAGNWKMHGTSPQLGEIDAISEAVHSMAPAADVLICPPSTLLARAAQVRRVVQIEQAAVALCGGGIS